MVQHVHVVPTNDLITHTVDSDGACICGPRIEPIVTDVGAVNWLYTHASLDGRETNEPERTD